MAKENWHALKVEDVSSNLKTNLREGLSAEEAKHRLEEYGPNVLVEEKKTSPLSILLDQFKSILVIVLIFAALVSGFILEEVTDAILIVVILVGNAVLGFVQEYRAEKAVEALKKMVAPTARVIREGMEKIIPSKDVVPGDRLVLEEGDRIVADARLFKVVSMKTDEAPLTGESKPVAKGTEILGEEASVADRTNMVYMGTHVAYGRGEALVTSTGMKTEFGKIAKLVQEVEEEAPPLKKKVEHLGRQLVYISASLCVFVFIFGFLVGRDPIFMFLVAVSMAVSAIPEGLPAVLTITLALGVNRLAKQKAVVKKLASVETLGCTTVICSDKTGTLTKNEMTVAKLYVNGQTIEVRGAGYAPEGDFISNGIKVDPSKGDHVSLLLRIGSLCSNASIQKGEEGWQMIGDPTEGALVVAAAKAGLWLDKLQAQYPRIAENPFASERKRMSTIHEAGKSRVAYVKGAPEIILERSDRIYENNGIRKLTESDRNHILNVAQQLAGEALRLLAMAYKELPSGSLELEPDDVESGLVFVGMEGMIDPARPEVPDAVEKCRRAGIRSVMITGDHKLTATAIAKQIGLLHSEEAKVLTGTDLDKMSDDDLDKVVNDVAVYARVSPEHKLRIAQSLKRKGQVVAMTGDGVNDAPAIKAADIGVAMGIKGTDVTKEAADLILEDDNFATIVTAVEGGRHVYDNIKKYCRSLIAANFDEFFEITLASIAMIPFTLAPIHILYLNLMSDGLPAVALSMDPPEEGLMDRPPRDPNESFLKPMWMFVGFCATIDYITDMIPFTFILTGGYTYWGPWAENHPFLLLARTEDLISITFYEIFLSFVTRSEVHPLFGGGIRGIWKRFTENKMLLFAWTLSWALSFIIIYTPFLADIFHLEALPLFWLGITMVDALSASIIWPKKLLYREFNLRNLLLIVGWMGGAALTIISTILIHRSFDTVSWIGLIIMFISMLMIYDIIPIGKKKPK